MTARLILLSAEFFEDFGTRTASMQFSGNNHDAKARLESLASSGFPRDWSNLMRWPMQCECGHSMEFAVLYYATRFKCAMCQVDAGRPALFAELTSQDDDAMRYHVFIASLGGHGVLDGEESGLALSALARFVDDADTISKAALDLKIGDKCRRSE